MDLCWGNLGMWADYESEMLILVFITLHQSIIYPWRQLSDFSHIGQRLNVARCTSDPGILALCDLERQPGNYCTLSICEAACRNSRQKWLRKDFVEADEDLEQ
jgi:hypothetical protein